MAKKFTPRVRPTPVGPGERKFYVTAEGQLLERRLSVITGAEGVIIVAIPPPDGATEVSEERGLELQAAALEAGRQARTVRAEELAARKASDAQALVDAGVPVEVAERMAGITRRPS